MRDTADLRLADNAASIVCGAVAARLRVTTDPELLARHLHLLRLVWGGQIAAITGRELDALAQEAAGRRLLLLAPPLAEATLQAGLARTLLALVASLAPHLPPPATLLAAGDPATDIMLVPDGPGAFWPQELTMGLGADPGDGPVAYALRIARATGWRPHLLLGAGSAAPPLLLAASL